MFFLQALSKLIALFSQHVLNRSGGTWPGEIILKFNPKIIKQLRPYFRQVIIITGTNGKTSTCQFINKALVAAGCQVITNDSGANLLNGVVSAILVKLPLRPKKQQFIGVFETDEYAFSQISLGLQPEVVIILNLFRDQLDRYGEVNKILARWQETLHALPKTTVIYPTADPALESMFLKTGNNRFAYRIPESFLKPKSVIAGDYLYCPVCRHKLEYKAFYLGHLGQWRCSNCSFGMLPGFKFNQKQLKLMAKIPSYQVINLQAVYLLLKHLKIEERFFWELIKEWQPAFGRGEDIIISKRHYALYLGKNPASWSAVLTSFTREQLKESELILGLNNRVPDGHDVSWIYDADFNLQQIPKRVVAFGDRAYDLAVRLKINGITVNQILPDLRALKDYLHSAKSRRFIFLANYSAILELRRLLTGKSLP